MHLILSYCREFSLFYPLSQWTRNGTLRGVGPATYLGLLETFRLNDAN